MFGFAVAILLSVSVPPPTISIDLEAACTNAKALRGEMANEDIVNLTVDALFDRFRDNGFTKEYAANFIGDVYEPMIRMCVYDNQDSLSPGIIISDVLDRLED